LTSGSQKTIEPVLTITPGHRKSIFFKKTQGLLDLSVKTQNQGLFAIKKPVLCS
jgi:hypothetical protein